MGSSGSWEFRQVLQPVGAPSGAMWMLQSILLCLPLSLALSGHQKPEAPDYPGELHCGLQSLQFTINLSQGTAAPTLIAWGKFDDSLSLAL